MSASVPERPKPDVNDLNRPFWDGAARHELVIQRCPNCERYQHEPILLCPACGHELGWKQVSGNGQIHTFVVMHQVYHPAFSDQTPYNVSVVQLDEGPFMTTKIVGQGAEELAIGQRVRVTYEDVADGLSLPCFELCPADAPGMIDRAGAR